MRRQSTPAEARLWQALRARSLSSLRVKRQVPCGPWIADFMIPSARLVIELDGHTHGSDEAIAYDRTRDTWFAANGFRVLRFSNTDVAVNIEGVLAMIASAASENPHPTPLPPAEEGAP